MKHFDLFLSWWLRIILISIGVMAITIGGGWAALWAADISKISFAIIAVGVLFTVGAGVFSYVLSVPKRLTDQWLVRADKFLDNAWFWASRCQSLGMIGTVIGFIFVFGGSLDGLDGQDLNAFKDSVNQMILGIGTALYTTLVGLICSFMIRVQIKPIQSRLKDIKKKQKAAAQ